MSKNKKLEDTLHSEIRRLEGKIDELNGRIYDLKQENEHLDRCSSSNNDN